ncbi:MAG: hypothetical protein RL538_248 [Candidatus Parcubacteria bacterium]|jgi:hypothetical protein
MDKKTVALIVFVIIFIVFSLSAVFYRYVVLKDYTTYTDDYSSEEESLPLEEVYE